MATQPSVDGPRYDFFIAHAGPDEKVAADLFDLLQTDAEVFLDSRCLELGDDFDRSLALAQRRSSVTVVLVSSRTEHAFYQREEIAAAIDMARGEQGHRVVPVYLTPRRELEEMPYGLRLKHGLEVSATVTLVTVASELLKLRARLAPMNPVQLAGADRQLGLDAVFSRDPTLALPATEAIIESRQLDVEKVVGRLRDISRAQIFVLRILLASFASESSRPMVERILSAGSDWHGALLVPNCLTPEHAPLCSDVLGKALGHGDPDVVRLSIEGLGYLGAQDWGWDVTKLIEGSSEYEYGKFARYAVEARARMAALFRPTGFDPQSQIFHEMGGLESLIRIIDHRTWPSLALDAVADVLARCGKEHADVLLDWLHSDLAAMRELGASALGDLRLTRSLPHVAERMSDSSESPDVRRRAVYAIGSIGGSLAVAELTSALDRSGDDALARSIRFSLARCLADAADDAEFDRLSTLLLDDPWATWLVYRAIGVRGAGRFEIRLRRGLEAVQAHDRGAAALALARVCGQSAATDLQRAYDEAVTPSERVLVALGLVAIGDAPTLDPDLTRLCADLAEDSYAYDEAIRDDIVAVLNGSAHPRAAKISAAWEPIYADGPAA